MFHVHQVWPKPSCKAQWNGEEDKVDRGRGGKTTSGNRQSWSSESPRGQWRTGKNGGKWSRDHLWCTNDPRGQGIDEMMSYHTAHLKRTGQLFKKNAVYVSAHLWPWNMVIKPGITVQTPRKVIIMQSLKDLTLTLTEKRATLLLLLFKSGNMSVISLHMSEKKKKGCLLYMI